VTPVTDPLTVAVRSALGPRNTTSVSPPTLGTADFVVIVMVGAAGAAGVADAATAVPAPAPIIPQAATAMAVPRQSLDLCISAFPRL